MSGKRNGGGLSASIILGFLLVPVAAVAAVALLGPQDSVNASPPEATIPRFTQATLAAEQQVIVEPVGADIDDLEAACGEDGQLLVQLEAEGTATDVQQAALDALRQVCEDEGKPLPGPPAPPPIVKTVVSDSAAAPADGVDSTDAVEVYDHHEDDEYEDEYEDHEDDEDDEEEEEHEEDEEDEDEHDEDEHEEDE